MSVKDKSKDMPVEEARAKLKSHFTEYSGEKYRDGWAELWERQDFLPWDRHVPSPALTDTLRNWQHIIGTSKFVEENGTTRRKRALVPGCGRGIDVLLLQSFGYDAVGLEYAQKAVDACEEYAKQRGNDELYQVKDEKVGAGSCKFVQGDFYSDEWLAKLDMPKDATFELIYDYTFLCAMHPSMRPAWAKRMSELLTNNPQANLICLEFPLTKPISAGGPPYGLRSKTYMGHLSHPGKEIAYNDEGEPRLDPLSESSPGALERVGHWKPADAHAIGKDKDGNVVDHISVWRHR